MEPTIQFSNISISEANGVGATNSPTRESQAGRQAAQEFESLMLSQLTSALHPVNEDEAEEGGGGEKDFVRQMVTEQLAKNLAEQGGLGVGNLLAKYVDGGSGAAAPGKSIERAIETARELRDGSAPPLGRREPPALIPAPKPDALTPNVITRPRRVTGLNPKPLESTLSQSASLSSSQGCGMSPLSTTGLTPQAALRSTATRSQELQSGQPRHLDHATSPQRQIRPENSRRVGRQVVIQVPPASHPARLQTVSVTYRTTASAAPIRSEVEFSSGKKAFPATIDTLSRESVPLQKSLPPNWVTGKKNIDPIIHQISQEHRLDPFLVAAVIRQESGFKQYALSNKGASGYMQLMPGTFHRFGGRGKNIFDPVANIRAGVGYLRFLSDRYNGNVDKVLAGYNSGEGNVDKYGGIPPFKETRNFVASVKQHYRQFVALAQSAATQSEVAMR